jgi:uncharacterized 2Fe-2S/4Fe-4S cluster protein (DUF4445 family)
MLWRVAVKITDVDTNKTYEVAGEDAGGTLLRILRRQGAFISAPCNGRGSCGKCRVRFLSGAPEATDRERRILSADDIERGVRLACACVPSMDCEITFFHEENICAGTGSAESVISHEMHSKTDHGIGDDAHSGAEATSFPQAYPGVCSGRPDRTHTQRECGIAIDIGTTTLAAILIDMATGEEIASATGTNHQRTYGADVISRIEAAISGEEQALTQIIRQDLHELYEKLYEGAGSHAAGCNEGRDDVCEDGGFVLKKVVIAGNTTMCHLLRSFPCEGLGRAPFTPHDISLQRIDCDGVDVVILPGISAFVGADIVSGIYYSRMMENDGASLLLDIGTNGEMVIGGRGGLIVTSTAAGPVFEGGNISGGVAGVTGAISHVKIKCDGEGSPDISYETIGDAKAIGICGSGVIDIAGELYKCGLCDETGLLIEPFFTEGFRVADGVIFTQGDIRQIQMAKAAIRAGIDTISGEYNASCGGAADHIFVAGGFGYFMDTDSAIGIGMFPADFSGRTINLGNSSLLGAKRFLLNDNDGDASREVAAIVAAAREINLAGHPGFNDRYLERINFS